MRIRVGKSRIKGQNTKRRSGVIAVYCIYTYTSLCIYIYIIHNIYIYIFTIVTILNRILCIANWMFWLNMKFLWLSNSLPDVPWKIAQKRLHPSTSFYIPTKMLFNTIGLSAFIPRGIPTIMPLYSHDIPGYSPARSSCWVSLHPWALRRSTTVVWSREVSATSCF